MGEAGRRRRLDRRGWTGDLAFVLLLDVVTGFDADPRTRSMESFSIGACAVSLSCHFMRAPVERGA